MSPSGWPKGKPRGPYSPERLGKVKAGNLRHRRKRRMQSAALAAGVEIGGEGHQYSSSGGTITITAAAFRSAHTHVGDCEFVDDGLDECLLRALHRGVVYASSVGHHHEPPFQDLTVDVIAATERHHRKLKKTGRDPRKPSLPLPSVGHITKRPIAPREFEIISLLAMGLTMPAIGVKLGITTRAVKARCDVLRIKMGVRTVREIPFAYKQKTGRDPFPVTGRTGTPLTTVVAEMFSARAGKPLLAVVSEMFDS